MDVRLKPIGQDGPGKSVPIKGAKFFIGRAEDCQLKVPSDLVSRHHCVIVVEGDYVAVRDFGSKNGTFVNGEKAVGEQELKPGDRLMIGQLEFEIERPAEIGGKKKPKVKSVTEAAARTVDAASDDEDDFDLDDWIEVDAANKAPPEAETQILKNTIASVPETSDTVVASSKPSEPKSFETMTELERMADLIGDQFGDDDDSETTEKEKDAARKDQQIVGVSKKTQEGRTSATSREAAGEALRRMFSGGR